MTLTLNKPTAGTRNWDVPVNQNWTDIENAVNVKADTDLSNLDTTGEGVIDGRAASVFDAKMVVVSALPANPDADTFYFIPD